MEQVAPKRVPIVGLDASVAEIIALMRKHRLDGVPVAEDGRLAGIVTAGDLITLLERVLLSWPRTAAAGPRGGERGAVGGGPFNGRTHLRM